tara:strand:+ start:1040 stop:1141 length:102 start_codon:yes stop_codon:yes gene_type:complete
MEDGMLRSVAVKPKKAVLIIKHMEMKRQKKAYL